MKILGLSSWHRFCMPLEGTDHHSTKDKIKPHTSDCFCCFNLTISLEINTFVCLLPFALELHPLQANLATLKIQVLLVHPVEENGTTAYTDRE